MKPLFGNQNNSFLTKNPCRYEVTHNKIGRVSDLNVYDIEEKRRTVVSVNDGIGGLFVWKGFKVEAYNEREAIYMTSAECDFKKAEIPFFKSGAGKHTYAGVLNVQDLIASLDSDWKVREFDVVYFFNKKLYRIILGGHDRSAWFNLSKNSGDFNGFRVTGIEDTNKKAGANPIYRLVLEGIKMNIKAEEFDDIKLFGEYLAERGFI